MNNQKIYRKITILSIIFLITFISCKNSSKTDAQAEAVENQMDSKPFFKLSLAEWSIHKYILEQNGDPFKFAAMAKDLGFEGLEYVNQLYSKEIEKLGFDTVIDSIKTMSELSGMHNVLIMVDDEGALADPDDAARNQAVENHKKWVDAAQKLGCHSIRVNTFGTNDPEVWKVTVVDGLRKLCEYAATKNINVICENHGWLSSDTPKLMEAIHTVNMSNCGTLPDFGNWCVKREAGSTWGTCLEEYPDKYEGIKMMLTAAKGVSAKSYDFDENGNETTLDYKRIIQSVKDSGYTNYIGVEYEGERLGEIEGIKATRDLLLKVAPELN